MNNESIIKIIENILKGMNVSFDEIKIHEDPETSKQTFVIKTKESDLLIGENGETFQALSHLIKRMAEKSLHHTEKKFDYLNDFSIDVNEYRKSILENLKIKALMFAKRAQDMKTSVEMEPMSSYERLI